MSRYLDANPVYTNALADDLATAPSVLDWRDGLLQKLNPRQMYTKTVCSESAG